MPPFAIVIGLLLTGLGVGGYLGVEAETRSWTALIPVFVGGPLFLLGLLGLKDQFRKHAMHLAAALGLIGFLAPAGRLISTAARGSFVWGLPTMSQVAMAVLCAIFVALCVKSFRDARKAREATAST